MDRVICSRNQKANPGLEKNSIQFKDEIETKISNDGYLQKMVWKKGGYSGYNIFKKLIMLSEEQLIGRK